MCGLWVAGRLCMWFVGGWEVVGGVVGVCGSCGWLSVLWRSVFVFLLVCNFIHLGMDSLFIITGHSGSFHPK